MKACQELALLFSVAVDLKVMLVDFERISQFSPHPPGTSGATFHLKIVIWAQDQCHPLGQCYEKS
jgi:hypothetical protein